MNRKKPSGRYGEESGDYRTSVTGRKSRDEEASFPRDQAETGPELMPLPSESPMTIERKLQSRRRKQQDGLEAKIKATRHSDGQIIKHVRKPAQQKMRNSYPMSVDGPELMEDSPVDKAKQTTCISSAKANRKELKDQVTVRAMTPGAVAVYNKPPSTKESSPLKLAPATHTENTDPRDARTIQKEERNGNFSGNILGAVLLSTQGNNNTKQQKANQNVVAVKRKDSRRSDGQIGLSNRKSPQQNKRHTIQVASIGPELIEDLVSETLHGSDISHQKDEEKHSLRLAAGRAKLPGAVAVRGKPNNIKKESSNIPHVQLASGSHEDEFAASNLKRNSQLEKDEQLKESLRIAPAHAQSERPRGALKHLDQKRKISRRSDGQLQSSKIKALKEKKRHTIQIISDLHDEIGSLRLAEPNYKQIGSEELESHTNRSFHNLELASGTHQGTSPGRNGSAGKHLEKKGKCTAGKATKPGAVAVDALHDRTAKTSKNGGKTPESKDKEVEPKDISYSKIRDKIPNGKDGKVLSKSGKISIAHPSVGGAPVCRESEYDLPSARATTRENSSDDDDFLTDDESVIHPGAEAIDGPGGRHNSFGEIDFIEEGNDNRSQEANLLEAVPVDEDEDEDDEADNISMVDEEAIANAVIAEPFDEKTGLVGWVSRNRTCTIIILVVLLATVIAISVFLTGESPPRTLTCEEFVMSGGSARFQDVFPVILNVTSCSAFLKNFTPQSQAISWLADEDGGIPDFSTANSQSIVERYALAVVFFSTQGYAWVDDLQFLSNETICDWKNVSSIDGIDIGVTECNDDGSPTKLVLARNNLNGTIPSELANLSSLDYINFAINPSLSGQIPTSIENVQNLADIRLFGCSLSGTIPISFGNLTNMEYVSIMDNQLSGQIPSTIGEMTLLENLFLAENRLTGTIPSDFGSLSSLRILHLYENFLSGSLPSEMSNLAELRQVDISYTNLTGGAENLCGIDSLVVYSADCYSQPVPEIIKEVECTCCSLCCSEQYGCLGNTALDSFWDRRE